jgi:hypothetical protein
MSASERIAGLIVHRDLSTGQTGAACGRGEPVLRQEKHRKRQRAGKPSAKKSQQYQAKAACACIRPFYTTNVSDTASKRYTDAFHQSAVDIADARFHAPSLPLLFLPDYTYNIYIYIVVWFLKCL